MKITQRTDRGLKYYSISGKEREPLELFTDRVFRDYPSLGYGTSSSGIRWREPEGIWVAEITHALSCD